MNLSQQIINLREQKQISQEELAEKIYVSRQTISNWEREKSYPDIHSLLLLSVYFDVSLDYLVKGDLEIMREKIDNKNFKKWAILMGLSMFITALSMGPILYYFNNLRWLILLVLISFMLFATYKVDQLKKIHNVQKYSEIVEFIEGKSKPRKSVFYDKIMEIVSVFLVVGTFIIIMLVSVKIF